MKKFISLAFCAVAACVVAFKMHSLTALASSQAVGNFVVAQSSSEDLGQESRVIDKVKKANEVVVPNKERSNTPELTLEQAKALEGTITNQYGIRDDVYEYIQTHIPKDNVKAQKAAIKLAQYSNQIYYHAVDKKQALEIGKKESLAHFCLSLFSDDWLSVSRGMSKLMRNTSARDKRMWDIDEKYFGWEAIGSGFSDSEEKKKCRSGDF